MRNGNLSALGATAAVASVIFVSLPSSAVADSAQSTDVSAQTVRQVEQRMQELEREVRALKAQLDQTNKQVQAASTKASEAKMAASEPVPDVEDNATIKWSVHGVTVADFLTNDAKGKPSRFGGGKFLPIFLAQYKDWLLFEGHIEFSATSEGETETSLEYAQLDARITDWLMFVAGKFLSPLGQFQQAQHPPWINKLPDRPAGFVEEGGDEPLTDVGVMARGAVPIGNMVGTYALYVSNGPRMGEDGPELEGFFGDNNNNKAVGGRLSLLPLPYLEIGASGMRARIKGNPAQSGAIDSADYYMTGADFAFTKDPWDVRGEFIHSHLASISTALDPEDPAPTLIPGTTWNNWYVQGSYKLRGLTDAPIFSNLEPVIRYSQFHVKGFDDFQDNEENRVSVGLDYWFGPSAVAKIAYEHRDFLHRPNENDAHLQFAFGF